MYPLLRESQPRDAMSLPSEQRGRGISRNVVFLGLTSLFTDVSSEMVSAVLPVYVMFYLRLSPLEFGLVDGLYQGVAAVVRVVGGLAPDRWRRYKEVAALGYGLSAVCKLGQLGAGSAWTALAAVGVLDRTGKGLRTAPRDALISLSSPRGALATAFGVHRALDTAGALLGPLVAFGLLTLVPNAFDAVFVASFCAAVVGLGVLLLFVENRPPADGAARVPSLRPAIGLLAAPRYRALVLAGAALGLATLTETTLGETRSVDDQVEWLDDETITYALAEDGGPARTTATSIWALSVDGGAPPRVLVPQAYSPAIVR